MPSGVPPHTIISVPVQTILGRALAEGAPAVFVAVQEFPAGSYMPPVLRAVMPSKPPHTIIVSVVPLLTALCTNLAEGAPTVVVGVHESVPALYIPPVLRPVLLSGVPPHTIILEPLLTMVLSNLAVGAPAGFVAVQLSVVGLYLPPVLRPFVKSVVPPHTIH